MLLQLPDNDDDDGDDDDNSDHNLTMSNHLKILALNCPISFFVQQSDFPITGMMFTSMFFMIQMFTEMFITINIMPIMKMNSMIVLRQFSPFCESSAWTRRQEVSTRGQWERWSRGKHAHECPEPEMEKRLKEDFDLFRFFLPTSTLVTLVSASRKSSNWSSMYSRIGFQQFVLSTASP